jgi:hypothetical protein
MKKYWEVNNMSPGIYCEKCRNGMAVEVTVKEVILACFICGNRVIYQRVNSYDTIIEEPTISKKVLKSGEAKCVIKYCKNIVVTKGKYAMCPSCKEKSKSKSIKRSYIKFRKDKNLPVYL